jgi:excisionase family DNA binding protein
VCPTISHLPNKGSALLPVFLVPRLLRVEDAARYLSATTWFVETLVRERQIPSLVLGKRRVIDVNDLDSWIEKEKRAALDSERLAA